VFAGVAHYESWRRPVLRSLIVAFVAAAAVIYFISRNRKVKLEFEVEVEPKDGAEEEDEEEESGSDIVVSR
jgi:hypothetical protein